MCFGSSGQGHVSAPDLSGYQNASSAIGNSAQQSGADQSAWAKQQIGNQVGTTQAAQGTLANQGAGSFQVGAMGQGAYGGAVGAANQNLGMAQQWGSPSGVAQAQAGAAAATGQSYNAARMNNQRQLAAYGVDPSQLKGGFGNLQSNLQQAGATGNAVYNAGQNRQLQGFGMTGQAVGQNAQLAQVGQGYTGQGASMTGQGVQLGNQTLATGSQAMLAPSQWSQTALAGQGQAANIGTAGFQNQLGAAQFNSQANTAAAGGMGNVVGMAGGLVADYFQYAADGGQMTSRGIAPRPGMRRFDDGGDVTQIPQQTYSPIANKGEAIDQGGTNEKVGLTDQEKQQQEQSAFVGGAVKGFKTTYVGGFADGGYPQPGPGRYADGGDVINVPSINIQPIMPGAINRGGEAQGQAPQPKSGGGGGGMMGGIMGGLGSSGGGSALGSIFSGMGSSGAASGAADYANYVGFSDGGKVRQLNRKRAIPGNGAQYSNMAQNPTQGGAPVMGTAGPMTFANGGMAEVNPNPERQGGVPQPRPQHMQNMHLPRIQMPHMPSANRLQAAHFADGGLPGPTWAMGGVADGGQPHSGPGMVQDGPSDGTGIDDQVHAKVSVGEYVVPADVVHAKGKVFFDRLVKQYHTPANQQRQQMGIPQRGAM